LSEQEAMQIFEHNLVRTIWDEEKDKCYFSVVDILADNPNPLVYWHLLQKRLKDGVKETVRISTS
jgi:hypothetical protein